MVVTNAHLYHRPAICRPGRLRLTMGPKLEVSIGAWWEGIGSLGGSLQFWCVFFLNFLFFYALNSHYVFFNGKKSKYFHCHVFETPFSFVGNYSIFCLNTLWVLCIGGGGCLANFSRRFVALRERLLFEEISSQGKNECVF